MTSLAIENVHGLPLLVVKGERSEVYTMNMPALPAFDPYNPWPFTLAVIRLTPLPQGTPKASWPFTATYQRRLNGGEA